MRQAAVRALGQIGDARAVEPLIATLKHWDKDVQQAAAEALGEIGDAQAVEPLIVALSKFKTVMVRRAAAEALGEIGDAQAVEPLIAALSDKAEAVREGVAKALGKISDARAVDALIVALSKDKVVKVCQAAAEALGEIGDARAVGPLIAALSDSMSDWILRFPEVKLVIFGHPEVKQVRQAAAKALVTMYRSGKIDQKHRQLILTQRGKIIAKHRDGTSHSDYHSDQPHYDKMCGPEGYPGVHNDRPSTGHVDNARSHTDLGIGVAFPL